jgi:uncharacterized protein
VYAERLATRGYDLIVVARDGARLQKLAARLTYETGRSITSLVANLNRHADLAKAETVLRNDHRITMLVNNAGAASIAPLLNAEWGRFTVACCATWPTRPWAWHS